MSSEITKGLVRRSQKGDIDAFGELYELYSHDMYNFAFYYTSSSYFAEEAVSDAVTIAFENIKRLKKAESFKSWLFKILFNCCKQKQREKAVMASQKEISALDGYTSEAETGEKAELNMAFSALSDEEREIILMSFACGYKSDEIGAILSMKSSTVRSKQSRAIIKMRTYLLNNDT